MRRRGLLAAIGLPIWMGAAPAFAQGAVQPRTWPTRPVTLVVPFAPGGIADITARTVAESMARTLEQAFVVDNRPSAGSVVASSLVAHAPPDGYTVLLMSNANAVSTGLFRKLPYDVTKDFAPVTTLGFFDLGLFDAAESRFRSLQDLIGHARANPGKLTIGSIAVGSTQHLAAELFKTKAGIDAVIVPYKGTPAVLTALRAAEVDVGFEIVGPMLPQVDAKVIRALAVASERRQPRLSDVPTVVEAGVAGYSVASSNGLAVPRGTPPFVIEALQRAASAAVKEQAVQQRLQAQGVRLQTGTPQQLESLLVSEIKRWGEVIRMAKIVPE
ncbi:MAG: tripartite tricarboxylate transporter substrate-binding protein [Caldimonas sp.]